MISIEQFIRDGNVNRPLLFLGKGPSFEMRNKFLLSKFFTIASNHSIRSVKADICSAIDFDVVRTCINEIYQNAKYLMIPWHPHLPEAGYKASSESLIILSKSVPLLSRMIEESRVIIYNLSSAREHNDASKVYTTIINSGDTLFNVFVSNGIKTMYSLGVDGGRSYASDFKDLIPLENGRKSFDEQDPGIGRICKKTGAEFVRLQNKKEIQVFVGSGPKQLIPSLVLDYSIKKHTLNPSTVTPLYQLQTVHRKPKSPANYPRTPFSFQRFFIPSLAKGRAFYMDSDMQVFADVGQLLESDFEGFEGLSAAGMDKFDQWANSNYAMLMLDCDKIKWNIESIIDMLDEGKLTYEDLMFKFKHSNIKASLGSDGIWNSLDHYEEGKTALLHYTDMSTQPWKYPNHPFGSLWVSYLREAISCGFIDKQLYDEHVSKGYVRKGLL